MPNLIIALSFNPHVSQQAYMCPTILRSKEQEHALSKVYPILGYFFFLVEHELGSS